MASFIILYYYIIFLITSCLRKRHQTLPAIVPGSLETSLAQIIKFFIANRVTMVDLVGVIYEIRMHFAIAQQMGVSRAHARVSGWASVLIVLLSSQWTEVGLKVFTEGGNFRLVVSIKNGIVSSVKTAAYRGQNISNQAFWSWLSLYYLWSWPWAPIQVRCKRRCIAWQPCNCGWQAHVCWEQSPECLPYFDIPWYLVVLPHEISELLVFVSL